jgi:hypothetical protein
MRGPNNLQDYPTPRRPPESAAVSIYLPFFSCSPSSKQGRGRCRKIYDPDCMSFLYFARTSSAPSPHSIKSHLRLIFNWPGDMMSTEKMEFTNAQLKNEVSQRS